MACLNLSIPPWCPSCPYFSQFRFKPQSNDVRCTKKRDRAHPSRPPALHSTSPTYRATTLTRGKPSSPTRSTQSLPVPPHPAPRSPSRAACIVRRMLLRAALDESTRHGDRETTTAGAHACTLWNVLHLWQAGCGGAEEG